MSVVLAGFLGRPSNPIKRKETYDEAFYCFDGSDGGPAWCCEQPVFYFGNALREHLIKRGRAPERWLILGTTGSGWGALREIVTVGRDDQVFDDLWRDVSQVAYDEQMNPELLHIWNEALNQRSTVPIQCVLTGALGSPKEQNTIFAALEANLHGATEGHPADELVFDVTYGLRHQPIIASYTAMMLRWHKGIKHVDFYYGSFQPGSSKEKPCPAVFIPICQQLAEACEAVATQHYTGSFRQIGLQLGLVDERLSQKTVSLSLTDETNRPDVDEAHELLTALDETDFRESPIEKVLVARLKHSLSWLVQHPYADQQMKQKATDAHERHQLFKASAYLYEAIVSLLCRKFMEQNPTEVGTNIGTERMPCWVELGDFRFRNKRWKAFKSSLATAKGLELTEIEYLRNAVMHGTESELESVETAIINQSEFTRIFNNGVDFYNRVSRGDLQTG